MAKASSIERPKAKKGFVLLWHETGKPGFSWANCFRGGA